MSLDKWFGSKTPSKRKKEDSDESSPSKKQCRAFSQNSFDWYKLDDNGIWHCEACRTSKFKNAYAKGHEVKAKTTNHIRHAKSGEHVSATTAKTMKEKVISGDDSRAKSMLYTVLTKDEENIISYLKCAYSVVELVECLGISLVKENCSYTGHRAITEFQGSLADVVLDDTLDKLRQSNYFSLSIDESTDRANHEKLIMYLDYLDNYEKKTKLMSNVQIDTASANAETITKLVLKELKHKEIDLQKMIGIGTDGASVMTGRHNGVVKRLRDEIVELIGVHCAAHRCSLAASQATKSVPELESYSITVSNIFYYFCIKVKQVK